MVIHRVYLGVINHSQTSGYMSRILSATNFTQVVMKLGFMSRYAQNTVTSSHTQPKTTTCQYNVQTVNDKNWQAVTGIKHRCCFLALPT